MRAVNISLRVFKVSKIKIRKHKVTLELKCLRNFQKVTIEISLDSFTRALAILYPRQGHVTLSGPITECHSCLRDQTSRRVTLPLNMSLCSQNGQSQDPLNFRFQNFTYCIMSPDERRQLCATNAKWKIPRDTPATLVPSSISFLSPYTYTTYN